MTQPKWQPDQACPGPLVWFEAPPDAAILECATCGYIVITGTFNDDRHLYTPIMSEGLAR